MDRARDDIMSGTQLILVFAVKDSGLSDCSISKVPYPAAPIVWCGVAWALESFVYYLTNSAHKGKSGV